MKQILILLSLAFAGHLHSQTTTFESFDIPLDTFHNGSDFSQGFQTELFFLPNQYDTSFGGFWSGFALSTMRNDSASGFGNQYSAIAGSGATGSETYALTYPMTEGASSIRIDPMIDVGIRLTSIEVTNNAYAFYSMRDGDAFAKKFGGASGDDPDFFTLHMTLRIGDVRVDTIDVQLADFTFSDNTQDYILDDWLTVDLSAFDTIIYDTSYLEFSFSSSDTAFGFINTPTYACLDEISYTYVMGAPSLKADAMSIKNRGMAVELYSASPAELRIFRLDGSVIRQQSIASGTVEVHWDENLSGLTIWVLESKDGLETTKMYHP